MKGPAFDLIGHRPTFKTQPTHFLQVLEVPAPWPPMADRNCLSFDLWLTQVRDVWLGLRRGLRLRLEGVWHADSSLGSVEFAGRCCSPVKNSAAGAARGRGRGGSQAGRQPSRRGGRATYGHPLVARGLPRAQRARNSAGSRGSPGFRM